MSNVTDFVIDNASGQSVRLDIQACLQALQSSNSKGSDLTTGQRAVGMWFLRSDTNDLNIINSSNGITPVGNINQDNLGLFPRSGGTSSPMLGQLLLDDAGDAAAPALSFDIDENLGLFRKSPDVMGFSSAGTEQMLFDANGLALQAQNELRFADSNSDRYVGFKAPADADPDGDRSVMWTLPAEDAPVAGYALISNASGTLSWGIAGAGAVGGGTNKVFWENDQTVTQSYTITDGKNAGSFGPIDIQSGSTVTIGSGETWTVV